MQLSRSTSCGVNRAKMSWRCKPSKSQEMALATESIIFVLELKHIEINSNVWILLEAQTWKMCHRLDESSQRCNYIVPENLHVGKGKEWEIGFHNVPKTNGKMRCRGTEKFTANYIFHVLHVNLFPSHFVICHSAVWTNPCCSTCECAAWPPLSALSLSLSNMLSHPVNREDESYTVKVIHQREGVGGAGEGDRGGEEWRDSDGGGWR